MTSSMLVEPLNTRHLVVNQVQLALLTNIFCDFIHSNERPNEDSKTDKQDPNYSVEDQTYAESSNNFRSQQTL